MARNHALCPLCEIHYTFIMDNFCHYHLRMDCFQLCYNATAIFSYNNVIKSDHTQLYIFM